jgi:septal ring factor EnvC (AmiA/AmiB activator)
MDWSRKRWPEYPDLVSHDADGEVVSVHYHKLVPMLLNEVQKQAEQIRSLNAKISQDQAQRASFEERLSVERAERASFEQRLSALEHSLAVRDHSQTLAAALGR